MPFDPEKHHRRSIRLPQYDYSRMGAYFVTICTHDRECLFGDIVSGEMRLNRFGQIVCHAWDDLPHHYPHVVLDTFVVMPDHVHAIIRLTDDHPVGTGIVGAHIVGARHGLPEIVRAFKTFSARQINALRQTPGTPVWQRNYYERIVHDEMALNRIREYIRMNPARWAEDRDNPHHQDDPSR